MGLGLIASAWANSWATLIVGTLIMSLGFHAFYPYSSALALKASAGRDTPRLLGTIRAVGALAAVAATALVLLTTNAWSYRTVFIVAGIVTTVGGLAIWRREQGGDARPRQRIVFRRRYWLYYLLTFLMGSRRHIFTTFAIFLLVEKFRLPAQQTALLLLVNNILGIVVFRYLGDVVGRVGERWALTVNFLMLIAIFLGYAYLESLAVLAVFFVLDHLLFGFNLALESYFQRIAISPEEVTSNMSMGQTINHVAALFVPVAGGLIWEAYGSEATFLAGTAIVVVSLVFTQFIRSEPQAATEPVVS
jgi:predicted MFS family arabinose efflux permease